MQETKSESPATCDGEGTGEQRTQRVQRSVLAGSELRLPM